ncbi:MAG: 3-keto-5-aminohexanoate cleavage protein [bacterium]|nr:3-keto-5-aminohexanoate cleavage protein [bacterium]
MALSDQPVIITCALVGAELSREDTPYLPLTPEEIVESALAAHGAGAAMVHIHVRDPMGAPTCREDIFREVIQKIRDRSDLNVQVSTGGAIGDTENDRLKPLFAAPDMASLSTGSINFGSGVFLNPYPFVEKLAQAMQEKGIKPEIEVFDTAMLETALNMVKKGLLDEPLHIDWVLGVPGGLGASEENLDFLIHKLPDSYTWSLAAIGRHQFPMAELALKKGGHVRVGMEDNIYLEKGVLAQSNADLVAKVAKMATDLGRPIADSQTAKQLLQLV